MRRDFIGQETLGPDDDPARESSRIEGWDAEAMAFWDQASPTEKAMMLQDYANRVVKVGNTKSYLLAAADFIARSNGDLEPLADQDGSVPK